MNKKQRIDNTVNVIAYNTQKTEEDLQKIIFNLQNSGEPFNTKISITETKVIAFIEKYPIIFKIILLNPIKN
jgi:hypothetical protein